MRILWVVDEMGKPFGEGIKSVNSSERSNPEKAQRVFINRGNGIIAEAVGIFRIVDKMCELLGIRVQSIKSLTRSNPKHTVSVFVNRPGAAMTETMGIIRLVNILGEALLPAVKFVDAPKKSSKPKYAGTIFI